MFRDMRLAKQQLSAADTAQILKDADYGTLALWGEDYPYSVPISYVYDGEKIYFHGATTGLKNDLLTHHQKVSLSVVGSHSVQATSYTMYYTSVIAFGTATLITDPKIMQHAMEMTSEKYAPGLLKGGREYIASEKGNFAVYEMSLDHVTGKRSSHLSTD